MQYVNMALKEIKFEGVGWIDVAQDSDQLASSSGHTKTFCS
jgi:hypothetical protein